MTNVTSWLTPELLRPMGWTLLHFLWQGAVLAAAFAVTGAVWQSAKARYAIAVGTLAMMMMAPVVTFFFVYPRNGEASVSADSAAAGAAQQTTAMTRAAAAAKQATQAQPGSMIWLVEAWFLGVVLLSIRTAGGLLLLERMRRREISPVKRALQERCAALQRKLGIDRVIRYCECQRLDAPAVMGWFRPVVLLPVKALTGLTDEQIEIVIAHELAHIRRLDCFVNLFQIAAETVLFYHPAVWWVSQRIRAERENCCDDEAIAACGDAVNYARALTLMEEWRTAPTLMMAANRGTLSARVMRLLGMKVGTENVRAAGVAASFAFLTGAVLAGHAFLGVAHASLTAMAAPEMRWQSGSEIVIRAERAQPQSAPSKKQEPSKAPAATPTPQPAPSVPEKGGGSYIEGLQAAGLRDLDIDQVIAMKIHGVTPEYIKSLHELGLQPDADEVIGMKVQGITPEYIREMRTIAPNATADELVGMKVQGLTAEYARQIRDLGLQADADELIGMKVQGVTPEWIRAIRATGLKPNTDEAIGMKVQGITPEYVKWLQGAGLGELNCDDVIGAKVQGITPEFIEEVRKHGFKDLNLDKLIALKHAGVF